MNPGERLAAGEVARLDGQRFLRVSKRGSQVSGGDFARGEFVEVAGILSRHRVKSGIKRRNRTGYFHASANAFQCADSEFAARNSRATFISVS